MSANRARAQEWFRVQQAKMEADLVEVRTIHEHSTTKGDGTEKHWLDMLCARLPARYKAARAFVIDADGERSDQIDIVIHDRQFCPALLDAAGAPIIPAESVYAVIEVKQDLSKAQIEYAGAKIASVRHLRRTSAEFPHAQGRSRTALKPIIGAIVALESGWSPAFGDPFRTALETLAPEHRLDLGCVLRCGAFEATYEESGEVAASVSSAATSLIFFFLRLLHRLQQIASVPAIDYLDWSRLLVLGDDAAAEAAGFKTPAEG